MLYLYGSKALSRHYLDVNAQDSDYDLFYEQKEDIAPLSLLGDLQTTANGFSIRSNDIKIELTPTSFLNNGDIANQYGSDSLIYKSLKTRLSIIRPAGLAAIKRSHLHRPLKWGKHIRDYHLLKPSIKVDDTWLSLVAERTRLTQEHFGDRTPKLTMSNDEFFDNYVSCPIVHDDIHYSTCFYDRPLYEEMKTDSSKAMCNKDLWLQFSDEDKTKCVQEECRSIALERKIIPALCKGKRYPSMMAYLYAIERVCTTLCGGFFRDWAIEHFPEVILDNMNFVDKFTTSKVWREYNGKK